MEHQMYRLGYSPKCPRCSSEDGVEKTHEEVSNDEEFDCFRCNECNTTFQIKVGED